MAKTLFQPRSTAIRADSIHALWQSLEKAQQPTITQQYQSTVSTQQLTLDTLKKIISLTQPK